MEDLRVKGMPTPQQIDLAKMLANTIDVLSRNGESPVSVWELGDHLRQNCAEAKGEGSDVFLSVTVAKTLDQMKQTGMIERNANGVHLTKNGRWTLLRKGKAPSMKRPPPFKKKNQARAPARAKAAPGAPARDGAPPIAGHPAAPALKDIGAIPGPSLVGPAIVRRVVEVDSDFDIDMDGDFEIDMDGDFDDDMDGDFDDDGDFV
jgi:hypothetical protein